MARRIVGAIVLLLALAGCGGDPKADPAPAPSPSTSPVSTTPTAPAMPAAAKANSKAGAIAFAGHYVDLVNHAQTTGDASDLAAAEGPDCTSCQKVRAAIESIYSAGGSIEGELWRPRFTVALRNADRSWLVTGVISIDPGRVRRSNEAEFREEPGGSAVSHLKVAKTPDGWKVLAWSRES